MKLTLVTVGSSVELSSSSQVFVPVTADLNTMLKVFAVGSFNQIESAADGFSWEDKELWKNLIQILAANGELSFKVSSPMSDSVVESVSSAMKIAGFTGVTIGAQEIVGKKV